LVCAIAATNYGTSPVSNPVVPPPTTSGFTWTLAGTYSQPQALYSGSDYDAVTISLYYISNAPAMSASLSTGCSVTDATSGAIQLFEFTGARDVDVVSELLGGTPGVGGAPGASAGTLETTATDIILVLASAVGYNSQFTTGTGYTLCNMNNLSEYQGATQYRVNAPPGSYPTMFNDAVYGTWVGLAVAFKAGVGS
jgi:hypothetical protein